MKHFLHRDLILYLAYILIALTGIWFLTRLWVPGGFAVAGHDSGLAVNASGFLKTRFFAWDDRVDFGSDNSPHFGSIIFHGIDYALSLIARTPYAGNQIAVFFWMSMLFIFSAIFSYSLKEKFGRYFPYLFPVFLTFNFFIFQSIFILERAKYELICITLLFLTQGLAILLDSTKSVLRNSIVFSLIFTLFNGGSWFGLPLYGGLLIAIFIFIFFAVLISAKEKDFRIFKRALGFSLLSGIFFVLLNLYSILPFASTLVSSDYAKVVGQETISAGEEWLNYISRGSSWLNLLRFQGVPDWYLTGGLPNPDHSYSGFYLTNNILILVSFLIPLISLVGLFFSKEKQEKYLVGLFFSLLLVSLFFTSGTNSPLGFIYTFLYEKIPGFSIFRSPYFKFGTSYIISLAVLLSYSLSKLGEGIFLRVKHLFFKNVKASLVFSILFVWAVNAGWLSYNFILFNRDYLFKWRPDESTVLKIPDYIEEFGGWLRSADLKGKILVTPPFDGDSQNDAYTWGYWSLSPLPSVLSGSGSFVVNDTNNTPFEFEWVNKLYSLLLQKDPVFLEVSKKLGVKYILLRKDFSAQNGKLQKDYSAAIEWFIGNGNFTLVKNIGQWSVYSIQGSDTDPVFRLTNNIFSVQKDHMYIAKELLTPDYRNGAWVDTNSAVQYPKDIVNQEFYPLNCDSCRIENLGIFAEYPSVRILPNSPLYPIKKEMNERGLRSARDDSSKLGAYLGLIMIKLSETRSMYDLKIDRQFVLEGLRDMNRYLNEVETLISNSQSLKSNFYFISKVYETLNPLQRYFRDYIASSGFGWEKPPVKDEIYEALWHAVSVEKMFGDITADEDRWNYEKVFGFVLPNAGQYNILVDSQTLPADLKGGYILPYKMNLGDSGNFSVSDVVNNRWAFVRNAKLPGGGMLRLFFQDLPDLFLKKDLEKIDFPEGRRGCLTGGINFFNKNRSYKLKISSQNSFNNFRLYIKENGNRTSYANNGFLQGNIVIDIASGPGDTFTYIYSPARSADNPQIYLCRYDDNLPTGVQINVLELFSPSVYVVKTNTAPVANEDTGLSYKKIDPTRYDLTIDNVDNNTVLVFNQTFNSLWKLYDNNNKVYLNHFIVDGYSNAWLIPAGKDYNLSLIYEPQLLFEKWRLISALIAALLLLILSVSFYVDKRHEKN